MRYFYTVLLIALIPFILLRLLIRGRKAPAYRQRWSERFGFFSHEQTQPTIWVHAVSVGEVQAAVPLVEALKLRYPQYPIVITTMTPTGLAQVKKNFSDTISFGHLPYDLPGAVKLFLRRTKPAIAIVMETELWPNLFYMCKKRNIPLLIANARLSPRSTRGYKRIRPFVAQVLKNVACVAAQSTEDADRFIELGVPSDRVMVTKNIKFDSVPLPKRELQVRAFRDALGLQRKIWIAASTHAGEDELVLEAYRKILDDLPDLVLLLVPRHPERFDDVARLASKRGFVVDRRSGATGLGRKQTQVFVGDSMGELMFYYQVSDLAFVGGSLVETGGHNVLEPAAVGVASLVGPYTFNFKEITQHMIAAGALVQVESTEQLASRVADLINNDSDRQAIATRAGEVIAQNRGATNLLLTYIDTLLPART